MKSSFLSIMLVSAAAAVSFLCGVSPAHARWESWKEMNAQVVSLYVQGRIEEALPLAKEALQAAEAAYPSEDPSVAAALNNLASLYLVQGNTAQAKELYQRALAMNERLLGPNHPSVAANKENLEQARQAKENPRPQQQPSPSAPRPQPAASPSLIKGHPTAAKYAGEEPPAWLETRLSLENGFRLDQLDWNIAGNLQGTSPNVLSELTWKDLAMYYVKGRMEATVHERAAFRGDVGYGWIFAGDNQDSDYDGNNRTAEFSRSNNASDEGSVLDLSAGLGYRWKPLPSYELTLTPLGGYSYHQQNLAITHGFQTIPATGPFAGLDSEYQPRWKGPWVGLDLSFQPVSKWLFQGTFEYHWADYRADARWNLRTDFTQPKSFRHTADGRGIVGSMALSYLLSERWTFHLNGTLQDWTTDAGVDRTFFSNGTTADTRLNEVNWSSYSISLGAAYSF